MKNTKSFTSFIGLIFSSFFRWWWAAITGFASIASWLFFPKEGILMTPFDISLLILIGLLFLFLVLSTIYQGWQIYYKFFTSLKVVGFPKSNIYGDDYLILLDGDIDVTHGTIIELKRFNKGVEVSMALVEIKEKNTKGQYQARPIWISSGHLRELRMGQIMYSEIKAETFVKLGTLQKASDSIIK